MITWQELNDNDVLLGRGTGPNEFIGNQRYRSLVGARLAEYSSAHQNKAKRKIAREIVSQIHELGGRFLKQAETEAHVDRSFEDGVFIEVEESVALLKCKQALRDLQKNQLSSNGNGGRNNGSGEGRSLQRNDHVLTIPAVSLPQISAVLPNTFAPVAPLSLGRVQGDPASLSIPPLSLTHISPLTLDERLLLFQASSLALQQPSMMSQPLTNQFYPSQPNLNYQSQNDMDVPPRVMHAPTDRRQQAELLQDMHRSVNEDKECAYRNSLENSAMQGLLQLRPDDRSDGISSMVRSIESSSSSAEDALAQSLCYTLFSSFEDRSRCVEELVAMEQATLTDEERSEALSDMFGKQCAIDIHHRKRARRDFNHETVEFLINQMRLEIERIPVDKKLALLIAQGKCHEDEFSDARLERFLRCEGMNVKLGAQRFVNYWEIRRDLFGPEKYLLHMTLSQALRDDLVALETGVQQILPRLDSSGRQMVFWEIHRHTRNGYTTESLLRALWYVMEVLAQKNNDINSGIVLIIWDENTSIYDHDRKLYDLYIHFEANCWPVKLLAIHVCCPSMFGFRLVKPFIYTLQDKHMRSRMVTHDVPDSLSSYGIQKSMLPAEMGGTVQLNPSNWIANRRAVELGEI